MSVPELNRPFRTPGDEPVGEEFGAIIEPNRLGLSPSAHDLLQYANLPLGWERCIDLSRQALSHAFIQHIEGLEAASSSDGGDSSGADSTPATTACDPTAVHPIGAAPSTSKSPSGSWPRRASSMPQSPAHPAEPSPRAAGSTWLVPTRWRDRPAELRGRSPSPGA